MQLGIDFGGTDIKIGVVDGGARVEASRSVPASGTAADLDHAAAAAGELLAGGSVDSVGIAVPGVVNRDGRMLHANDKYDWARDIDLRSWGARCFGAPVIVENDARAALVGEVREGAGVGADDVVLITLGTGIGTAALVEGRLVRGAHGHAGILGGHVTVDVHAPACPCGNIGCGESLASTWALANRSPHTAPDLRRLLLAERGTESASLADAYLRVWGAVAVTMCHMFDPALLILSGGVLSAGERVRRPLEAYVDRHLWPSAHRPEVRVAAQPHLSVVRGLARLAREARDADPVPDAEGRDDR